MSKDMLWLLAGSLQNVLPNRTLLIISKSSKLTPSVRFGVGELSAINAIAGAFSEHVPVVHIVGMPSTTSQRDGMLLHHTLGNGNFNVFADMNREISVAMAKLNVSSACPMF
jgi:TPP-dependent 2-oxoacid decarboxylase